MTRTTILVFTLFSAIFVLTLAFLLTREQTLPDNTRAALDKFIGYRYPSTQPVAIQQFVHATMPSKFTPEMSGTTFGESHFYQTMVDYGGASIINLPNLPTATPGLVSATYWRGSTPLPFPPEDAWCVVLKDEEPAEQILIVALHQSLYTADWIVHEPSAEPGTAEMKNILAAIGCGLK